MKFLRQMGVVFFSIILINLIGLLVLSYEIKPLLVNGIIKEIMIKQYYKTTIEKSDSSSNITNEAIQNNEALQEILNSKEVQDLLNKYLEITMKSITSDEDLKNINIEKDILDYLKEHKELLEQATGKEITDEMIDQLEEQSRSKEISRIYKDTISTEKNKMDPRVKKILIYFDFFVSQKFRLYCIIGIIIDILLIMLLQFSLYKWLKALGTSMIFSGSALVIMGLVVMYIIKSLSKFNINLMQLIIIGSVIMAIGIVLVIIYNIIRKIIEKKKVMKNELSQEVME